MATDIRRRCAATLHLGGGCACNGPALRRLSCLAEAGLSRRGFVAGMAASVASLDLPNLAAAQSAPVPAGTARPIVPRNLRLFDGTGSEAQGGRQVLVRGPRIVDIASGGDPGAPEGARILDCGGRVLMPGLTDAHGTRCSRPCRCRPRSAPTSATCTWAVAFSARRPSPPAVRGAMPRPPWPSNPTS